jgi:hypothetical protein
MISRENEKENILFWNISHFINNRKKILFYYDLLRKDTTF